MDLRRILKQLQGAVRAEREVSSPYGRYQVFPESLRTEARVGLQVGPEITRQIKDVVAALLSDLHYEHLGDGADAAVWEFVCYAAVERSKDHVPGFLETRRRELLVKTVRFGIAYLTVGQPFDVYEVTFLPLPGEETEDGQHLRRDETCGSLAKVEVSGTDMGRMVDRGREHVRHALRVLRFSLANVNILSDSQLRFKLSQWYVMDDYGTGFHRHSDAPIPLDVPKPPAELIESFALLPLRYDQGTEIGRQATLALSWIDEARLSANLIHKVAFLFSALEAMLGDRSAGLKAPMLVYYRTLLGQVVNGYFPNPARLYAFYDEVRSNAVHGEDVPAITKSDVSELDWSIRSAFDELLAYSSEHRLTRRSQLRKALLATEHAGPTYEHLKTTSPEEWWRSWSPWGLPKQCDKSDDGEIQDSDPVPPVTSEG